MVISYRQFGIPAAASANVSSASSAAQNLKLEISGLKQKIDQLNASFLAEQAGRIKAEGERDSALATVNQKDGELATARTAISQRDTAIRDRDATIAQKDNTIGTVARERDDARGSLAQRTNELNARVKDLNDAVTEVNRRGGLLQDLERQLSDSAVALDQASRVAAMVPSLEANIAQVNEYAARVTQERDAALADAQQQRLEVDNQRSIGQRMLDEANKTAEDRMARAMARVSELETAQGAAQQASADLQEKLRLLDQQYTEQLAAQAQAAQAAAEAAQAELQKARDACAADLGAAASAKEQVDAMLAAAQDEANKCQAASKKSASTAAPAVSPILALVGGVIAGFAAGKMKR